MCVITQCWCYSWLKVLLVTSTERLEVQTGPKRKHLQLGVCFIGIKSCMALGYTCIRRLSSCWQAGICWLGPADACLGLGQHWQNSKTITEETCHQCCFEWSMSIQVDCTQVQHSFRFQDSFRPHQVFEVFPMGAVKFEDLLKTFSRWLKSGFREVHKFSCTHWVHFSHLYVHSLIKWK